MAAILSHFTSHRFNDGGLLVVDVVNLFYEDTAEHDAYETVARRFESIRANVGEYPPIIAASIQRIIRDEANPDTELELLANQNDFDINQLNADWDAPNAPVNPRVTIDDLEKPLWQTELMPSGWTVHHQGGKHWDVTNPLGRTVRVTTDVEAYQHADGRLQWWQGPPKTTIARPEVTKGGEKYSSDPETQPGAIYGGNSALLRQQPTGRPAFLKNQSGHSRPASGINGCNQGANVQKVKQPCVR